MLALALAACGGDEPARGSGRAAGLAVGVNLSDLFDDPRVPDATIERALAAAERDGIRIARADALWDRVEPAPGRFDWRFSDRVARMLARHGIRWWAVLEYAPRWAGAAPGALHSAPRDPAAYGRAGAAFIARYGPRGEFWRAHPDLPFLPVRAFEVWNEPNSRLFWQPRPDPAAYAATYAAAARALGGEVELVVGGLVPGDDFLSDVVAERPGLRREIRTVAVHPYAGSVAGVVGVLRGFRAAADAAGLPDVALAVTEVGWVSDPPASRYFAAERARAALIPATLRALAAEPCVPAAILSFYAQRDRRASVLGDDAGPSRDALRGVLRDPPALAPCP